jgi:pimeloyl-ACP methyl ester carboxylesterase
MLPGAAAKPPPDEGPAPAGAAAPRLVLKYVHSGGRRLAFYVVPGRAPAILFEAGGGMDASAWWPVIGPIHEATGSALILYDRAGEGQSDEDPRPYRLENAAADLEAGLNQIVVPGRLIFVGHSFGGEVGAQVLADNRGRFAGAVLVDGNLPAFFTPDVIEAMATTFARKPDMSSGSARAVAAMMKAFPQMQTRFHAMRWPQDVPVTVVVSDHPPLPSARQRAHWMKAYEAFVAQAPNRRLVLAKGSSHLVMLDRPDVVEAAVIDAVRAARAAE